MSEGYVKTTPKQFLEYLIMESKMRGKEIIRIETRHLQPILDTIILLENEVEALRRKTT